MSSAYSGNRFEKFFKSYVPRELHKAEIMAWRLGELTQARARANFPSVLRELVILSEAKTLAMR